MIQRLPVVSGKQVIKALERAGFRVIRIKGSHHFLRHAQDAARQTVVPVHGNEDLGRPLLRKILSDAGLTAYEFEKLL